MVELCTPTVSVVLPNYNHSLYLKERIESILNQTYQDFELILLDDCSTDNSREILSIYKDHPKVSALVLNEENTGNTFLQWDRGIRLARGKYVWIAESDDTADIHFLEYTIPSLEQNPDATMCLTGSLIIDEAGRLKNRKSRDRWKDNGEIKKFNGKKYVKHNLLYRNYVYNASMVVFRRDVYPKLDMSYQKLRYAGDWQFWMEVAQEGSVIEVRRKLNNFRQHLNKVSHRAKQTKEKGVETITVMHYILSHTENVNMYRQWMVKGECYDHIHRLHVPIEIHKSLYQLGYEKMGMTAFHYYLGKLNKVLSFVFPLPTHRRDKLK